MTTSYYSFGRELSVFAFESITVGGSAVGFTAATINPVSTGGPAQRATVTVETNPIRYRIDAAPTSSIGHLLNPGDVLVLEGRSEIKNIQFIATGSNGTIMCTYERLFITSA